MRKLTFALLLLFCVGIVPVFACTPTITPSPIPQSNATSSPISLEERAQDASIVFVGTVTGGEYCYRSTHNLCQAEIEVEQYLKGEGAAIVWVDGFGAGTDCNPIIYLGSRAIFFVSGNPDAMLQVLYFGYSQATPPATDENIARIIAITNQSTIPEALPIETQIARLGNRYEEWIALSLLITMGISIVSFLFWRRSRRKSKAKREEI